MTNYYNKLSEERKRLQEQELLPEWFTTGGYQLFKQKYLWASNPREQYEAIAATAASHTDDAPKWRDKFFQLLWKGWLSPSTPVLANMGTTRGLPVSCSGSYVPDNIDGFYSSLREMALLTKGGFGTSSYLGDVRPRGARISTGGEASGIMPVLKARVQASRDVSQGSTRRGADASYIPLDHADFDEVVSFLANEPDDLNIGWVLTDAVRDALLATTDVSNTAIKKRFAATLKAKAITGKGYYWKVDTANRKLPPYYPIANRASNLCSEINLPSDENHTFTCQPGHAPIIKKGVGLTTMDSVAVGDEVWSAEGWTKVMAKQGTGVKPVYEYRTALGTFIGTEDHRVVENGVKVEVKDAESIDAIQVTERGRQIRSSVAVINGLFLGDGTLRNGKPVLCVGSGDYDYYEEFGDALRSEGYKFFRETSLPLSVDVSTHTYERDFDVDQFSGQELSFLRGLFSANGAAVSTEGDSAQITLTCTSPNVAHKAMWMLQSMGYSPRMYKSAGKLQTWSNGQYQGRDRYDIKLLRNSDIIKFRDEIGFIQKHKMEVLARVANKPAKTRRIENVIKEVSYVGDYEVYHIEVDNSSHTYWTGGVNVSNCVLSSMNAAKYDEWKESDAVFTATVFLDCVASEFIAKAKSIPGLENAVRFTEKARALGLGVAGFHTYLQSHGTPFDSMEAIYFNDELFKKLDSDSLEASMWMGDTWGYAPWCQEYSDHHANAYYVRNCSRIAIAPTKSTALIMGGISEGINPDPAMTYNQSSAGGEVDRINPVILNIMKERGVYTKKYMQQITDAFGSVQGVDWLSDEEKAVFKTAFEINQHVVLRLASQRAKYIDQWQSLNLFFSADADPKYILDVHKEALRDDNIIGLYYMYSKAGVAASKADECAACQ